MNAAERGDLAERMVPHASHLAFLVRTEGRERIGTWLDVHGITDPETRALLVVLAAMVPVDLTEEQMLDWITWDEQGRPLDGTIPLLPAVAVPDAPDEWEAARAIPPDTDAERHRADLLREVDAWYARSAEGRADAA
jgi:hypothetical protein